MSARDRDQFERTRLALNEFLPLAARRAKRAGAGVIQAALLTTFGAIDLGFYSLQTHETRRNRFAAAYHFSTVGRRQGLSLSPLISFRWMREGHSPGVKPSMWGYPEMQGSSPLQTHPLMGTNVLPKIVRRRRSCRRSMRQLLSLPSDSSLSGGDPEVFGDRIVVGDLTTAIATAFGAAPNDGMTGRDLEYDLTVIVDDVGSWERGLSTLKMLQKASGSLSFEVILAPLDNRPDRVALLAGLALASTSVTLVSSLNSASKVERLNQALRQARGRFILCMHVGHVFPVGAIQTLTHIAAESSASAVQPVVIDQTGLIRSAGVIADPISSCPMRFLSGVSLETADLTSKPFAMDAVTFPFVVRNANGKWPMSFNPDINSMWLDADFSARMAAATGIPGLVVSTVTVRELMSSPYANRACEQGDVAAYRRSHVPSASRLHEAFSATTLEFRDIEGEDPETSPASPERWRQLRVARPLVQICSRDPKLRWSIKTAAPIPQGQNVWGDSYFADGLASSLRKLGQIVCVDTVENSRKPLPMLDDVVINLRGLAAVDRVPGVTNVIWVISHPDLVSRAELESYDLAYAASEGWARRKSKLWDTSISALLQCTDPSLFQPDDDGAPNSGVLFVGNTRGQQRPIVEAARSAGVELTVYGSGWDGIMDEKILRGESLPRESLPHHYAKAMAVLNDHWPDMRREGFISNRLFDIVASGGWAVTDTVSGLEKYLGSAVASVATAEDLVTLLRDPERYRPGAEILGAAAEHVRRFHTFDVRARQLLDDVTSHLAGTDNSAARLDVRGH